MKKWISLSLLVVLLLFISACSKDEPTNSASDQSDKTTTEETAETPDDSDTTESEEPAETTAAASGEEVFKTSCITCHSSGDIAGGQAKLDATKIKTDFADKTKLHEFVSSKMPKNAPGSLSAEEYESVVNYLWEQQN